MHNATYGLYAHIDKQDRIRIHLGRVDVQFLPSFPGAAGMDSNRLIDLQMEICDLINRYLDLKPYEVK